MAANKSSAVADQEPIDVLFALHPKFDLLDFAGPLEVITTAAHDFKDDCELYPTTLPLPALASTTDACPPPPQPPKPSKRPLRATNPRF